MRRYVGAYSQQYCMIPEASRKLGALYIAHPETGCERKRTRVVYSRYAFYDIEVDPEFSGAPHLRSSIHHAKTYFSKKSKILPMNNAMAKIYKKSVIFSKHDWFSDDLGVRNPVIQKQK